MTVTLRPMDASGFEDYRSAVAEHYAREKVRAGQWSAPEVPERSEKELDDLLPDGLGSEGYHFCFAEDEAGRVVGKVWFRVREEAGRRVAWRIFDVLVPEPFRGRGFGSKTLRAAESKAKELGAEEMGLHVFAHNAPARALYEKAGYEQTSIVLAKPL